MKILYVAHAYPPHGSGVGTFVQAVARGLVRCGHQVWVIEPYHPSHGAPVGNRLDNGVQVITCNEDFWPYRLLRGKTAASRALIWLAYKTKLYFLLFLWASRRAARFIARFANENGIDLVEAADGNESGLLVGTPFSSARLVVRIHGSVHLQETAGVKAFTPLERKIYKRIERRLVQRADALVAVSKYAGRQAEKVFDMARPVPVIYNMVSRPTGIVKLQETAPFIVFVGRIGYDKGVDTLGKAWNEIASKIPGLRLVILGNGDRQLLTAQVDPQLRHTIEFKGSCSKSEVFSHLASAKCFVLPSRFETFGLAMLEALLARCPVVFTRRCCGPELIRDGVDGLLVNPDNANELTVAILRILTDEVFRQSLIESSGATADRFSNEKEWIRENEVFYKNVLKKEA